MWIQKSRKNAMNWACRTIKEECSDWKAMRRLAKLLNTRRYEGGFLDFISLRTKEGRNK
jgi:hypothetical protein